ncbi:MAG: asparagine synthase (glutamine-hydrolyzing) [Chitinophagaceae bacterium]|nr:MAG: asparagine synthase (glutamine-hydrolyzing) [Chitinophagaceae bacterium]
MGGITGFLDHTHCLSEDDLIKASETLAHRGTLGSKIIIDQKEHYTLALANIRLATIDLSENANQPLTSYCNNYCITFNGTIYNYLELRESLIKYGVTFSTLSDSEVIIESYKKWGYKAFEMLDGSFAFALLDRKLNQLLIARDELGAKPLYYYKTKGFYAFGSEIKALLSFSNIKKDVNKNAVRGFFRTGYFIGEETIYQNIYKFKKGTLTTIDLHSGNSYDSPLTWLNTSTKIVNSDSEDEILRKIEDLLTESILKRNVADVPTGVLLSGGYDSSMVAAILQKNQTKRIKTFTVGFNEKKFDEASQAKNVAEHLNTNHQDFYLDKNQAAEIAKSLPEIFDEPIAESSAIALAFIGKQLTNDIKVLLGTEGGDELFGGHRTYAKAIALEEISQKESLSLFEKIKLFFLRNTNPKIDTVLKQDGLLKKYIEINACFSDAEIDELLNFEEIPQKTIGRKPKANSIKDLLLHDLHNYLPDNLLARNDKAFMMYGVESRDTVLSTDLVAYLATLDASWFLKDGEQKYLLKQITHKYVPENLIKRPKKGFVIPLANWLKTSFRPLVEEYVSESKLQQHQLFNTDAVLKIKKRFYSKSNLANAQKLWMILQFQMWYDKWIAEN